MILIDIFKKSKLFKQLFCLEMWNIGRTKDLKSAIDEGLWKDIEWLDTELENTFYADPVGIYHDKNISRILFEKLDIRTNKGCIVSISEKEFSNGGPIRNELIDEQWHLSYPTTKISQNQNIVLIPERAQSGKLQEYERIDGQWLPKSILIDDKNILDPTFHVVGEVEYLFYTSLNDGPNSKLCIAMRNINQDSWAEHPNSPIDVGEFGARPAGPLFSYEGVLIRPGQDNRAGYGSAIILHTIRHISPSDYEEDFLQTIHPPAQPYNKGTHSILVCGEYVYLDAKRYDFTVRALFIKFTNIGRKMSARFKN